MEKRCQNCGQPIDPNARFCRYCGHENVVEEKRFNIALDVESHILAMLHFALVVEQD
ncbi:zinc-ribbon domain-containing protein [Coprobacillaceae bacterium CR2/5/TPMF4]|nr:zinc-ribbon domain-containing protein [Coprobacillaceae bacterium CR2/5/TPMF4]